MPGTPGLQVTQTLDTISIRRARSGGWSTLVLPLGALLGTLAALILVGRAILSPWIPVLLVGSLVAFFAYLDRASRQGRALQIDLSPRQLVVVLGASRYQVPLDEVRYVERERRESGDCDLWIHTRRGGEIPPLTGLRPEDADFLDDLIEAALARRKAALAAEGHDLQDIPSPPDELQDLRRL